MSVFNEMDHFLLGMIFFNLREARKDVGRKTEIYKINKLYSLNLWLCDGIQGRKMKEIFLD